MRSAITTCLVLLFAGCRSDKGTDIDTDTGRVDTQAGTELVDADGDGFDASVDCDDDNVAVYPGAAETCDGIDNNCDGTADEGLLSTWYADDDFDGYGDPLVDQQACVTPAGHVAAGGDCNDADATIHPGADEICDGSDNDCDGTTDDASSTDATTWYRDVDGDGWGVTDSSTVSCAAPAGFVVNDGDCDDTDPAFHPGALEGDCTDPADYNCDGSVGWADADSDGHAACDDCDDTNPDANPDATEVCDGADNDCDSEIDEDSAADASTWYADADGDGHGGSQFQQTTCSAPPGYVATADDCNDLDPTSYPGASEVCDEADNDCDGDTDEGVLLTWYADGDGDGYGSATNPVEACAAPAGYVANGDDCDDANAQTSPASYEICDGADNDCDGSVDDNPLDASNWYEDTDGDGYGDANSIVTACDEPTGYVSNANDCDDSVSTVNPGATEACDGTDNDCDGSTDENDAFDAPTWYADADADGYGNSSSSTIACNQPAAHVLLAGDCDDTNPAVSPAATEVCDTIDNDCNGSIDGSDASDATTWYFDGDSDNYGLASSTTTACSQPGGHTAVDGDCDDNNASVNPGGVEFCDGADNDCNGVVDDGVLGTASSCPATGCLAILQDNALAPNGSYYVDPENDGSDFETYCDMNTDGGGWTLAGYSFNSSTSTSSGNHNMRSLRCADGTYTPTNRGQSSATIDARALAQGSTEMAISMVSSNGATVSTGGMDAYGLAWKFTIPDPASVTFDSHSYSAPEDEGPCVAVTVQGIYGDTSTATKYTYRNALGVSWTDTHPTGYGVSNTSNCVNHEGGPFITSVHTCDRYSSCGYSGCDVTTGDFTYTHRGNYRLNSTGHTGSAAIWFR